MGKFSPKGSSSKTTSVSSGVASVTSVVSVGSGASVSVGAGSVVATGVSETQAASTPSSIVHARTKERTFVYFLFID
ncbi:hypothetical protein, partial [uncultured Mesotoga sp.]|uniref:hypothetical protein n=1 Tax=uncultured Mesotoga sp. TaxID=1184400 RepID=UPI00259471D8